VIIETVVQENQIIPEFSWNAAIRIKFRMNLIVPITINDRHWMCLPLVCSDCNNVLLAKNYGYMPIVSIFVYYFGCFQSLSY